jgi:hypothetical protein
MKIHSEPPGIANKNALLDNIVLNFDRRQIYYFFHGFRKPGHKKIPHQAGLTKNCTKELSDSFFLDPCSLTASFPEEVKLGTANLTSFVQGN